jgi:hypothetical protein
MVATVLIAIAFAVTMVDVGNVFQKCVSGSPLYHSKKVERTIELIALMFLFGASAAYFMGI